MKTIASFSGCFLSLCLLDCLALSAADAPKVAPQISLSDQIDQDHQFLMDSLKRIEAKIIENRNAMDMATVQLLRDAQMLESQNLEIARLKAENADLRNQLLKVHADNVMQWHQLAPGVPVPSNL